jgi:hypothetical protein
VTLRERLRMKCEQELLDPAMHPCLGGTQLLRVSPCHAMHPHAPLLLSRLPQLYGALEDGSMTRVEGLEVGVTRFREDPFHCLGILTRLEEYRPYVMESSYCSSRCTRALHWLLCADVAEFFSASHSDSGLFVPSFLECIDNSGGHLTRITPIGLTHHVCGSW